MRKQIIGATLGMGLIAAAGISTCRAAAEKPEGWENNSGVLRGPAVNGLYASGKAMTEWKESEKKNVLWKVELGGQGWSSPVVWGDKVIVTIADEETRTVLCYDAATGKQLWKTAVPKIEGTTDDYQLDTMDARWDVIMHAAATAATDGKLVFAAFSNGQLAALKLEDGAHVWSVALGDTSMNSYGLSNSPLIYKDKVIMVFEGDPAFVAAYNRETGKEVWKTRRTGGSSWASPVLAKNKAGQTLVILSADPELTAWNADDGKVVWSTKALEGNPEYCIGPSATVVGGVVAINADNCGIFGVNLEDGEKLWSITELDDGSGFSDGASMTTDGKLLYQFFEYSLTVIDPVKGEVVVQKELDEMACYGSPIVVDGKLYIPCGNEFMVVSTGTEPAVVGQGSLNEATDSTPAFANGRIFIRTDEHLYAVGK